MSMKLRGLLLDNYRAKVEQAYMHTGEAIVLKDVPCEMDFETSGGWIEYESEKHQYLPVFHLIGQIKEIHGNFPYNVSTLTFSESDAMKLQKDIVYYMNPKELAHMIEVGKFFTDKFKLPEILVHNNYSFPCRVNLTIVPPPNPAAYEQASFELGLSENSIGGIDKDNLPVFYIGFAGTGINRKHDKLLDYYGIEFDEDFPMFALTAEASGYTDPPLMEYITEPIEEAEEVLEETEEMYISPEEEAEMIKAQQMQQQQQQPQINLQDDYQLDQEDIILAQADRNVEVRVKKLREAELAAKLTQKQQQQQAQLQGQKQPQQQGQKQTQSRIELQTQKQAQPVQQQTQSRRQTTLDKLAALEKLVGSHRPTNPAVSVIKKDAPVAVKEEKVAMPSKDEFDDLGDIMAPPEEVVKEEPVVEQKEESAGSAPVREGAVSSVDVTEEAKKAVYPEAKQQMKEVEMDFNPEANEFVTKDRQEPEKQDESGLSVDDDINKLKEAKGADVSDARLQAKLDEAKAREAAKAAAVEVQQDISVDGQISGSKVTDSPSSDGKHREVTQKIQDVADANESTDGYDDTLGVSY